MHNAAAKSTSTDRATWKNDCRKFCKAGVPFKVTGIDSDEDKAFIAELAAKHGIMVAYGEDTAYFSSLAGTKKAVKRSDASGLARLPLGHPPDIPDRMGSEQRGKTFLVVEDSSDDALLIRRAFASLDACKAIICRNLSEGRAYMLGSGLYGDRAKYPFPNAIICDLHIGFESGVDFVLWVKQQAEFKEMPVIILTGTATTSEAVAAKQKGALDVLRKPSRYEDLRTMLNDLAAKLCG